MKSQQTAQNAAVRPVFIRIRQVLAQTGLSQTGLYKRINAGTFPKSLKLGDGHATRWVQHEIDAWMLAIMAERDGQVDGQVETPVAGSAA